MLRNYQATLEDKILAAWQLVPNVIAVLPTGGGKTPVFSSILNKRTGPRVAIAHRQELVGQMSLSLAHWGVKHRIIAPDSTVREIIKLHFNEFGKSYFDASAHTACAGVDTLSRRKEDWFNRTTTWVVDEAHHLLRENKWGEAVSLFPHAKGLGVTANTIRADGKGLGSHSDGVFDMLIQGPTGRELMDDGWLCRPDVYTFTPSDLSFDGVEIGSTGDFKLPQLRKATHASRKLVGDVVKTYLTYARGKRGITFAVDVEQARELTLAYNEAGVRAQLITANTPLMLRQQILRSFRKGELDQLVNVDLFGEGFDVPAVEVVSMARRTDSYNLFCQQIGRSLRPIYAPGTDMTTVAGRLWGIERSGKPFGIILDHVGNYIAHALRYGLPEDPKPFTLDARERRGSRESKGIPLTGCTACGKPYESYRTKCPYCGNVPEPAGRDRPEQVDGDLHQLDLDALRALAAEVAKIDAGAKIPYGATHAVAGNLLKNHHLKFTAQQTLRDKIASWGGYRKHEGLTEREAQKKFYLTFGIDVLTAQTLNAKDAAALQDKIERTMT
jgi:DNA repair protein RadD